MWLFFMVKMASKINLRKEVKHFNPQLKSFDLFLNQFFQSKNLLIIFGTFLSLASKGGGELQS